MSTLSPQQSDFLHLLVQRQALRFGDFTLKSGRKSPYFINTGCFNLGGDLAPLGQAYASTIYQHFGDSIDVIFGPAYKGIPLALACAQAYELQCHKAVGWTYDRKETKDHGDGGDFVGADLAGKRVVIVDDVLTAGTALRESLAKLSPIDADVCAAVISVDRQEKGQGNKTACEEITEECGVPVHSIITITEAADYLAQTDVAGERYLQHADYARIQHHLAQG